MTDALTPDIHGDGEAVAPVGTPAPSTEPSVESGSATDQEPKSVPVERFNGLMATLGQTQNELKALQAQVAAFQADQSKQETEPDVSDDTTRQELAALRNELAQERLERARQVVLDEFPDAKPFGDLIVASTVEEMRGLARELASRAAALKAPATPAAEADATADATATTDADATAATTPETEATETAPVIGGAPTFDGEAPFEERVSEAIQAGDFAGFLNAKVAAVKAAGGEHTLA